MAYNSLFIHKHIPEISNQCQGQVVSLFKPVHQKQSFQED